MKHLKEYYTEIQPPNLDLVLEFSFILCKDVSLKFEHLEIVFYEILQTQNWSVYSRCILLVDLCLCVCLVR